MTPASARAMSPTLGYDRQYATDELFALIEAYEQRVATATCVQD